MFTLTKIYRQVTFYLRFEKRSLSLGINQKLETKTTSYFMFIII